MKPFSPLLLLAALVAALLTTFRPGLASAQPEPTPILGEPVVVTPLVTPAGGSVPPAEETDEPAPAVSAETPASATTIAAPDACEPNDTPAQACALPLDGVSGPFTIVPEADQDFFRLDLPQEASIQTVATVRATEGLELVLSARQNDAIVASGTYSLTLAPVVAGPVVLRVENRDPRPAAGEQYRIEIRREIAPPSQQEGERADGPEPDALENNWSFETASAIAVGVVYDLSFACPDPRPGACPGGDHDYLLVPVKAGVAYLITTFDLDPGVDTVVELFWGSTTTALAGNDDYAPGSTLSALTWTAPGDGILGVRIAPRNGALAQQLAEPKAGYRFAVAPLAGELARKLDATIRQQANVPTPTATTAAAPSTSSASGTTAGSSTGAAASGGMSATPESIAAGAAVVVRETVLRREPRESGAPLATLPKESRVTVRGPVSGLWVSVESDRSMLPGWVRAADLERISEAAASATTVVQGTTATPVSQQPGAGAQPTPRPANVSSGSSDAETDRGVTVTELDHALPEPPPPPVARVPFAVTVTIAASDRPPSSGGAFGVATPTPDLRRPIARVRVQLVNVFGDLLAEGFTSDRGAVTLNHDVRSGDALLIRVPAWGVEIPLAADQTRLDITIPEATP
jgi:hypothetical protein